MLDPAETWLWDATVDCWSTEPTHTVRTKKVPRNHVKAEATEKHPAQVEVYYEDVSVGTWRTVRFSGMVSATRARELSARVVKLQEAVKVAREEANSLEVEEHRVGEAVLRYVFG